MSNILKLYSNYKSKKEQQQKERSKKELSQVFKVSERNGSIYLMCSGNAVYKANDTDTVNDLLKKLEEMRNSTYVFENLNNK